jgi:hypothetical protein
VELLLNEERTERLSWYSQKGKSYATGNYFRDRAELGHGDPCAGIGLRVASFSNHEI